jgi:ribonuclease HI/pterin-4a-carbinolamine dehydratase
MWQETKHGLYKQFNFADFKQAFAFMTRVAAISEQYDHHPRWENEWNVVQIWLSTHEQKDTITDKDRQLADLIDEVEGIEPKTGSARTSYKTLKLYTDGGSRGNPGPSASGFVIMDENDQIIVDRGVYLGVTTNNQAEYTALRLGLEECLKLGVRQVDVLMDSLLVVNQLKGVYKVRNRDLWPIHDAIKTLATKFQSVSYRHIPRELNKLADAAVNRAIDDELSKH